MVRRGTYKAALLDKWLVWLTLNRCERAALGLPATNKAFAAAYGVTDRTLRNWRKRFVDKEAGTGSVPRTGAADEGSESTDTVST